LESFLEDVHDQCRCNADTFFIAGEDGLSALTASNMFAYANGNPIRYIDPTGEFAIIRRIGQAIADAAQRIISAAVQTISMQRIVVGLFRWEFGLWRLRLAH